MPRHTYWVYILKCSDDSYYVGSTTDLARRLSEHQAGLLIGSYTSKRLPVEIAWFADFPTHDDAFQRERQIKGWSRAKKEALIRGDWDGIHNIVKPERKKKQARSKKK